MTSRRDDARWHRWTTEGTLSGYFWVCSCGASSDPIHPSAGAAADAAEAHARDAMRR